ncbi:DoxX family protein [Sinomonas sp. G460-2]|uniref:DoxX family protein n=1 Tax=Sinomonas sp. G460-2 TaxID=3393464 RepID=UPI0039F0001A
MSILTIIVSLLLGVLFLAAGVQKIRRQQPVAGILDGLGVGPSFQRTIGVLEVLGGAGVALGLLLEPLGVAAGIGLALLMIGALAYHLRARDGFAKSAGPVVFFVVAAAATALQIAVI